MILLEYYSKQIAIEFEHTAPFMSLYSIRGLLHFLPLVGKFIVCMLTNPQVFGLGEGLLAYLTYDFLGWGCPYSLHCRLEKGEGVEGQECGEVLVGCGTAYESAELYFATVRDSR